MCGFFRISAAYVTATIDSWGLSFQHALFCATNKYCRLVVIVGPPHSQLRSLSGLTLHKRQVNCSCNKINVRIRRKFWKKSNYLPKDSWKESIKEDTRVTLPYVTVFLLPVMEKTFHVISGSLPGDKWQSVPPRAYNFRGDDCSLLSAGNCGCYEGIIEPYKIDNENISF